MSIGCSIYFAPVNRSWTGSPEFIQGVINLFGVEQAEATSRTTLRLPSTETLTSKLAAASLEAVPEDISEGWVPIYAVVHRGPWEVYDQGGDQVDGGNCCVELGNRLGYPEETAEYLAAFLQVPAVVKFQRCLEELSSQPWSALMELT